jgi:hypothetical protein
MTCAFQNGFTRLNRSSILIVMGFQSFGWADGPWRTALVDGLIGGVL